MATSGLFHNLDIYAGPGSVGRTPGPKGAQPTANEGPDKTLKRTFKEPYGLLKSLYVHPWLAS